MNDNDPLPPQSKITKLVKNTLILDGSRVDGSALIPRSTEEYMSVSWLEYDGDSDLNACIQKIINIYIYEKKFTVRKSHWLPIINVVTAIDYVKAETPDQRKIQMLYKPESKPGSQYDDPSHSGVFGYSHQDKLIGDLLSEKVESLNKAGDFLLS